MMRCCIVRLSEWWWLVSGRSLGRLMVVRLGKELMKVVFTAFNRSHYMQRVLASWALVRGLENVTLDFYVEPECLDMEQVITDVVEDLPCLSAVHVNDRRLGVQVNPYCAINSGFASFASPSPDDFVILGEDDIVVGADILEYFSWACGKFASDKDVLAVSSHQHEAVEPWSSAAISLEACFRGWVWGIWRDRWEQVAADWTFQYEHNGWDWRINDYWCKERGFRVAHPHVSRAQHIGQFGGVRCTPDMFDGILSKCFVADLPPQEYFVAEVLDG